MKIDITKVKEEIVTSLLPLKPDKIILFGSYAYGKPRDESDLDLFLIKENLAEDEVRSYKLQLQKQLLTLQKKYLIGIDLFVDNSERVEERITKVKDQFYQEIFSKGKLLYAK